MMQKISKALANKNLRLAKRSIGFKKSKQVMAVLLSTALGMTSLPQGSTYVYAAEPMEESQTQELTEVQTTSGTAETSYSNIEDETA
ncbi:MAG: hypothetical protein K2O40_01145, partial [Lachnospiraceae bacterium]|nr:hypothetical protein [Lachnospiraceae bacterium]